MPDTDEREHLRRSLDAIETRLRRRPGRLVHRSGLARAPARLVVEDGGFLYDSDSYADDLPYWVDVGGRPHLVIPYTLDANDFKFLLPNGFVTAGISPST